MLDRVSSRAFAKAEALTIWVIWLTYGSFYFCRTNISAAVPGISEEFGFNKEQIGLILGSLKIAYGVGQLLNGQLAERFSARKLLAIGMLCSATLNVAFGLSTGLYFLLFIWATNGYFQAFGWTPCMRVGANWFAPERRGQCIGIIGTGYQATAALTFLVSTYAVDAFGWRYAFYIPALMLTASCAHMLFFLKEAPAAAPSIDNDSASASSDTPADLARPSSRGTVAENLLATLSNPAVWFLGLSLGLLNSCRYGFLDWGITHLIEVQAESSITKAGIKYSVLPLGGIAGAYASGWASDRFFSGRRAPVIFILLVSLGLLTIFYERAVTLGMVWTMVTLTLVGFAIYGPQVLLVGTAPVDLARRGTPAAAVGFVNFMGYLGAFMGDQVTGTLAERTNGWQIPVYFWACCAFGSAIGVSFLWNQRPTALTADNQLESKSDDASKRNES